MPATRCPLCHRVNAAHAWQCPCGQEFARSAEVVRARLRDRQTSAWIALVLLTLIGSAAVAGLVQGAIPGLILLSALGFTAVILVGAPTGRTLRIVRARLGPLAR